MKTGRYLESSDDKAVNGFMWGMERGSRRQMESTK